MERNDDQSVPLTLKKIYEPVVQIGQVFCFREAKLIEFKGLRRWRSLIAAAQMQTRSRHRVRCTPTQNTHCDCHGFRACGSLPPNGFPDRIVTSAAPDLFPLSRQGVHYPGPLSRELDIPVRISRLSYREW